MKSNVSNSLLSNEQPGYRKNWNAKRRQRRQMERERKRLDQKYQQDQVQDHLDFVEDVSLNESISIDNSSVDSDSSSCDFADDEQSECNSEQIDCESNDVHGNDEDEFVMMSSNSIYLSQDVENEIFEDDP